MENLELNDFLDKYQDALIIINKTFEDIHNKNIFNELKPNLIVDGFQVNTKDIKNIIINGCGGTGGWFIPKLAKILIDASLKSKLNDKVTVYLCDGDTVSNKNLIRQNFALRDVGKNKAEVLATRYASVFPENIDVVYVDKYIANRQIIDSYDQIVASKFVDIATLPFANSVYSDCNLVFNFVDNAVSRRCIHSFFADNICSSLVIDSGNNLYNGQVRISHYGERNFGFISQLPSNYYFDNHNEISDNEFIKLENCADNDLAQNNPEQMFNVNDFSASVTANVANNIFADSKVYYGMIKFVTGKTLSVANHYKLYDFNIKTADGTRVTTYSRGVQTFANYNVATIQRSNNNIYAVLNGLYPGIFLRDYIKNHKLQSQSDIDDIISSGLIDQISKIGLSIDDFSKMANLFIFRLSDFGNFINEKNNDQT